MSLGSLLRYIGVTLGVLGSFMKHLGHQNREKDVYDGDMVVSSGTMGDFWGVMGAKREAKEDQGGEKGGKRGPGDQLSAAGMTEDGPRMGRGWARDGPGMMQGGLEYNSEKVLHRQPPPGGRFLTFLFDQRLKH